MHDAHPSELAGAASSSRGEKQNAQRVAWVEHRSTIDNLTNESLNRLSQIITDQCIAVLLEIRRNSDGHRIIPLIGLRRPHFATLFVIRVVKQRDGQRQSGNIPLVQRDK
jgi:hypothetical protein